MSFPGTEMGLNFAHCLLIAMLDAADAILSDASLLENPFNAIAKYR